MHINYRIILAIFISLSLAVHGLRKKSLDSSGAVAAIIVGLITFICSLRFGIILILFYYTSSKFTKLREDVKSKLEDNYSMGGQRNYIQVFANSILATMIALLYYVCIGEDDHFIAFQSTNITTITIPFLHIEIPTHLVSAHLLCMYISHYACASADTWASELGILSRANPRLVTTLFLREVPKGIVITNRIY